MFGRSFTFVSFVQLNNRNSNSKSCSTMFYRRTKYFQSLLPIFTALLIFLLEFLICNACTLEPLKTGEVNKTYCLIINDTLQTIVQFPLSMEILGNLKEANLRVETSVMGVNSNMSDCPVLFAVVQRKQLTSWELPYLVNVESRNGEKSSLQYSSAGRTLCIDSTSKQRTISVVVSTCSSKNINFTLKLTVTSDLLIPLGKNVIAYPSPTYPLFFRFEFPLHQIIDTVLIKVHSEHQTCMTLSVQKPNCPVFDDESNVQFEGIWQTVSSKTGITIQRRNFPKGFFLVFVVNNLDSRCEPEEGVMALVNKDEILRSGGDIISYERHRQKLVTFSINPALNWKDYIWPTLFPLVIYLPLLILTTILFGYVHKLNQLALDSISKSSSIDTQEDQLTSIIGNNVTQMRHQDVTNADKKVKCTPITKIQSALTSAKFMEAQEHYVDRVDCSREDNLENQSFRFFGVIVIIAVFYCIPVFQLVIHYLKVLYRTGEQDVCYYNHLCSHPLGPIVDFNHIQSNIGYVILGISFMGFVFFRHRSIRTSLCNKNDHRYCIRVSSTFRVRRRDCQTFQRRNRGTRHGAGDGMGIYQHYGMFYALGFTLVMEGCLSAGYHVCPNRSNFQFDTSFMYAMAVLSYLKVYQFRHSVYLSATFALICLGIVVASVFVGLQAESIGFRILVSLLHLTAIIVFQIYLLHASRNQLSGAREGPIKEVVGILKELCGFPQDPRLLIRGHPNKILFWWTVCCNIILIINYWTLSSSANFATQVLYVLLANLLTYVTYYLIMKGVHQELCTWKNLQPGVYLTLSILTWTSGMYYFTRTTSQWEKSPAESRAGNDDCVILNFYDNHDIWHFLSATGLFFSFMFFLTVDDSLMGKRQEYIPVF